MATQQLALTGCIARSASNSNHNQFRCAAWLASTPSDAYSMDDPLALKACAGMPPDQCQLPRKKIPKQAATSSSVTAHIEPIPMKMPIPVRRGPFTIIQAPA
ncbi:MAG TPA: hypothetical protein VJ862_04925, partial [Rhodanobacteraceae bacterium]|nr:hypothetical protein [Rhodanobacteraceae bacterium]